MKKMKHKFLLAFGATFISFSAFSAANYTIPPGIKATTPLEEVKCPSRHSQAIHLSKKTINNGSIYFEVDNATGPEWKPKGKFKIGKPNPHSSTAKAVNEYDGPIPAVLCVKFDE